MSDPVIQIDYEQLEHVKQHFSKQADIIEQLHTDVSRAKEALQDGGWEGRAATAFYAEMDADIFPALTRLQDSLRHAAEVTAAIRETMSRAEEEAAGLFQHTADSSDIRDASATPQGASGPASHGQSTGAGLPPRPAPPPPPPTGDGSGPHHAQEPTMGSYLSREIFSKIADGADALGLDHAAQHMRHYLNNTGEELRVSPEQMLADLPGFQEMANQTFQHDVIEAVNARIAKEYTGQPMSFQLTSDWKGYYAGKSESSDWYYAMGGYSYAYGAEVQVTPGPDGKPHVDINYQMHVFDRYNWDEKKGVEIGGVPIKDSQPGHLHTTGLAREYEIWGASGVKQHSYDYTPQPSSPSTIWHPEPSTDQRRDDPRRDPDGGRRWGRGEGR